MKPLVFSYKASLILVIIYRKLIIAANSLGQTAENQGKYEEKTLNLEKIYHS